MSQNDSHNRKPLRLWPGVALAVVVALGVSMLPLLLDDGTVYGIATGFFGGLAIALWWLFLSRAPWLERIGVIVLMALAVVVTKRVVHPSIANGMMGMMLIAYAIPVMGLALVIWAATTRRLSNGPRRVWLVATVLFACGLFALIRTGGITGSAAADFHWRWTKSPEEQLLAENKDEPVVALATNEATATDAKWPGFRGPGRDGVIRGVNIETDWSRQPPVAVWRRPVGPGWSSFAVQDNLFYTQEQRGEYEIVSCYNLTTGQPVWRHSDAARFWESNAGAGPRGTPTLHNGRVYALGATGILNALDARNGAVVWSRNAAADTKAKLPGWGFAGSPLVVEDVVIVSTSGALAAYDVATGNPRWIGPVGSAGYSSPHLMTIGGVTQVLLLNGEGLVSVAPADGKVLWQHAWKGDSIVQPGVTADGDLLIGSGSGMNSETGLLRIGVANGPSGWTTQQRWISTDLMPYFNDFVVHGGHAFGFNASSLVCIDLKTGEQKWKGKRYGYGQIVLLSDQDLLLVLSEQGELALVKATPDQFSELARFKAIEGKTWNHPVLVDDVLLVRNAEEMAAFRLALSGR